MAVPSFSSLLLPFLLSLLSTAFKSMHGFIDDPLIQQVVSSSSRDDLLTSAEHRFSEFKKKYGKAYPTQEEDDYRFGVFISNLRQARRNQIMDRSAVHGVTKFSDLTPSEFRRQYFGSPRLIQLPHDFPKAPLLPTDNLPPTKNWTYEGAVTAVKNQKACNGCWAFSTIAVLEGAHFLANRKLVNLSEQQLIDCSTECTPNHKVCNDGCNGGHRLLALEHIKNVSGVVKAEDYRFAGVNGNCNLTKNSEMAASISESGIIGPDENQYAAYLVQNGPIAVNINIEFLLAQTYEGGVLCPEINCIRGSQHAVVLVGYNGTIDSDSNHQRNEFWWIVKNSFGNDWGELGYFRVCGGALTACSKDPTAIYIVAQNKITFG